jgi:hypothetical protein
VGARLLTAFLRANRRQNQYRPAFVPAKLELPNPIGEREVHPKSIYRKEVSFTN